MDSWKEIAEYLGRERTTVMRWERQHGLPVRRVGSRSSVFAYKGDLDRWLAGRGTASLGELESAPSSGQEAEPLSYRPWRVPLAVALIGLLIAMTYGFGVLGGERLANVAKASLVGGRIVAVDSSGQELWRHQLPSVDGDIALGGIDIEDLDQDGRPEAVCALRFNLRDGGEGYGELLVLENNGRTRWRRTLDAQHRFGAVEYGPAWFPDDLLVYRSQGLIRISVAQHHHTWWPAIISTYDRDGHEVARFVHAGWIKRLKLTADRRYLLAAGVSNMFGGPALAVLDAGNPAGVSPSDGGTLPPCGDCPSGFPVRYFVAPWTELARPAEMPYVGVVQVTGDGLVEWRAAQRPPERGKAPEVIVTFSPRFEILHRTVDDFFVAARTLLDRAAPLRDPAADWRHPDVREWTPERGWIDSR